MNQCITKNLEDTTMLPTVKNYSSFPTFLDDLFSREFLSDYLDKPLAKRLAPSVNIVENADSFRIDVAAPGLSKEDIKIDLNNRVLTISSEKSEQKSEEKNGKVHLMEFSYGSFSRSFSLPTSVNVEKISASHKDGVLTILLPKRDESKEVPARQISIS